MTNSDSTIPNPHDTTKPLISINLGHFVKLTPLTYVSWRFQLMHILFGYSLFGFLDGSTKSPPPTVSGDDKQETPNPAYLSWLKQDGLILGALIDTLSATVQALIVRATSSKEPWDILSSTYNNPSRARVLQLKDRLDSIVKTADQSISDYMNMFKTCIDQLALLGKTVDPDDIVSKVLRGLDYNLYKPVIDTVRARDNPISFDLLHEKLLHQELLLKQQPSSDIFQPTANLSYRHNNNYRGNNRHHTNAPQYTLAATPASASTTATSRPFKGRCQWCRQVGHVIANCPHFRKLFPNIIFLAPPTRQPQYSPQANTATSVHPHNPSPNPNYLLDSASSHHVTHDLDTLYLHSPYFGPDDLIIGDGSTLDILNIGNIDGKDTPPGQG